MKLSESKTRIVHTMKAADGNATGFNFLDFSIRQYPVTTCKRGYKTLIKPSLESQKIHRKKMSKEFSQI